MRIVVGVAEARLSSDPSSYIVTYSLGSCVAICIHDPVAQVGGMLHFMLPDSKLSPEKAAANPCMFADTGIPLLFREAYRLGADKARIAVKAVGGAQGRDATGLFEIGKRNIIAMRKIFWQNGVILGRSDLGGSIHRTATLEVGTGEVRIKMPGGSISLR